MCELDAFVGNFTLIDWDIYKLWLNGYSSPEAVQYLKESTDALREYPGFTLDMLISDVNDSYRLFGMLETAMLSGSTASNDCFSQFQLVDGKTKQRLVESYYSLDSELCREIVGKKLSSRLRKDLDEICEKPTCRSIRIRSARRQYDNVKRVFKTIEEMAGEYVTNIMVQFGLSKELADKYATLVFASSFRFEMSKKRLNYLSFENIMSASLILINDWIDSDGEEESVEPSLDKDFLTNLRDLKALQDRDKEHRGVVCSRLEMRMVQKDAEGPSKACVELENNFKTISKGIISVAVSLSHNKEVKDFFVLVVERVIELFRSLNIKKEDADIFLTEYSGSITDGIEGKLASMLVDNDIRFIFARFMKTFHPAVMVLYPEF